MKEKRARRRAARSSNGAIGDAFYGVFEFFGAICELIALLGRGLFHVVTFPFRILGAIFDGF